MSRGEFVSHVPDNAKYGFRQCYARKRHTGWVSTTGSNILVAVAQTIAQQFTIP